MTRPRQVLADRYYLITRRCAQRQFLLSPSPEVNNVIAYCLADAARRHGITVLISTVESNHHHTVIHDREGTFPRFIEHFHKMVAKCLNALRGRRENLWASGQTTVTELLDYNAIVRSMAYVAANPVKDMLVERATQWPGLNGYVALIHEKPIRTRRPRFFHADRTMPEELTLTFTIPEKLERAELVEELKALVEGYEREARRSNRRIVGRKTILEQSWQLAPRSVEARRTIRPRFAGRGENLREAVGQYRMFLEAYARARRSWVRRGTGRFPAGTYWLVNFTSLARVARASASSTPGSRTRRAGSGRAARSRARGSVAS